MSDYTKLPLQDSLNRLAILRAASAIGQTGRALPCTVTAVAGSIVTVKFDVIGPQTLPPITIPKAESEWLRASTQVGDRGITVPAATSIADASGLGSGIADTTRNYGNLSNLVWVPVSAVAFVEQPIGSGGGTLAWVNGPNGAVIGTKDRVVEIILDGDPSITSTVQNAVGTGATLVRSKLDAVANSITHELTGGSFGGTLKTTIDGAANAITHELTDSVGNAIKTIVDGAGKAISHVVPTGGGVGLGALFGSLPSTQAIAANADLSSLGTSLLGDSLQSLMQEFTAAMATAGVPNAAALQAIVTASNWILSNITHPTIPGCSSKARAAS